MYVDFASLLPSHKDYGDKIGEVLFENNNLTISNKKHKKYVLSLWQRVNAYDIFMSIYLTNHQNSVLELIKKSLKIPKGQSETVYRITDNTMAKRKSTKGQTTIDKTHI
jgi:hypothetical protein